MNWVDACWDNLGKWAKRDKLHPDDVAYLERLTYDVARKLGASLVGTHRVSVPTAPTFFARHGDLRDAEGTLVETNLMQLRASSYKLSCAGDDEADELSQQITAIIRSKGGNVFSPYWLITPGDRGGERIKRGRYRTRLAVWDDGVKG